MKYSTLQDIDALVLAIKQTGVGPLPILPLLLSDAELKSIRETTPTSQYLDCMFAVHRLEELAKLPAGWNAVFVYHGILGCRTPAPTLEDRVKALEDWVGPHRLGGAKGSRLG